MSNSNYEAADAGEQGSSSNRDEITIFDLNFGFD